MELKEGMYVRYVPTLGEYIQKISKITKMENRLLDIAYYLGNESKEVYSSHFDEIINTSFNLIDLIEVGDYVNGEKVTSAEPVDEKDTDRYLGFGNYDYYIHTSEDIKSVVTKEQFNACKYVVERDK